MNQYGVLFIQKSAKFIGCCAVFTLFMSCSPLQETARTFWGTSTRALDKARDKAFSKSFYCSYEECFDVVLQLARSNSVRSIIDVYHDDIVDITPEYGWNQDVADSGAFNVFLADRMRAVIVVMGVPGQVDTTEVGIFFAKETASSVIRVDISSLSTGAKRKVADKVFQTLKGRFGEAS